MKKIFLGFACVGLLAFTSCSDSFLKEEPKTALAAEAFFTSYKNAEAAVNNLYRSAAPTWINGSVYGGNRGMWSGWQSGLFDNYEYGKSHAATYRLQTFALERTQDDGDLSGTYNDCFIVIQRANNVIQNVPGMDLLKTGITEAQKKQLVAEARFFRAYNYMYLVRFYGAVPLMDKTQTAADDLEVSAADVKTLWAFIITDLKAAVADLPAVSQYSNSMRVTATTASAALTDALVYSAGKMVGTPLWSEAAAEAKKFLPGGTYAGQHQLETNDFDATLPIGQYNPGETSAYNKLRNVGALAPVPAGLNPDGVASAAGVAPATSKEYIYVYEYKSGISNCGLNANAFGSEIEGLTKVALVNNAYRPDRRMLDLYDSAQDLRMWERQFYANYFIKPDKSVVPLKTSNRPSPYFFYDYGGMNVTPSSGRHWAHYRLAEMYLFAAEAIAEAEGVTATAIDALVAVKKRAFINKTEAQIRAEIPTAKQAFIQEVWRERYRELALEYKVWYDIQRTEMYPKTHSMDAAVPVGTCEFVSVFNVTTPQSAQTGTTFASKFSTGKLVWPLGNTVTQRNPKVTDYNPY